MADRMKVSGPFMLIQIGPPEPIAPKIIAQLTSAESSVRFIPDDSWIIFRVPSDKLLQTCLKLKDICSSLNFEIELDDCRS